MNNDLTAENYCETSSSKENLIAAVERNTKKRYRHQVFSCALLCSLLLILIFYFFLPPFQAKNTPVSGNSYFTVEDIAVLSNNADYKPLLFLNAKESSETALLNGNGLLLSCEYTSNGFSSSAVVLEDYPKITYSGSVYFSSSLNALEGEERVNHLPLSEERKNEIKEMILDEAKKAPSAHVNPDFSLVNNDKEFHSMLSSLQGIPKSIMSYVSDINFRGEKKESFYSVSDFLFSYNGHNYLLQNCLYNLFDKYFTNHFEKLLNSLENNVKEDDVEMETYVFSDSTAVEAYTYKIAYNPNENKTTIYK